MRKRADIPEQPNCAKDEPREQLPHVGANGLGGFGELAGTGPDSSDSSMHETAGLERLGCRLRRARPPKVLGRQQIQEEGQVTGNHHGLSVD